MHSNGRRLKQRFGGNESLLLLIRKWQKLFCATNRGLTAKQTPDGTVFDLIVKKLCFYCSPSKKSVIDRVKKHFFPFLHIFILSASATSRRFCFYGKKGTSDSPVSQEGKVQLRSIKLDS